MDGTLSGSTGFIRRIMLFPINRHESRNPVDGTRCSVAFGRHGDDGLGGTIYLRTVVVVCRLMIVLRSQRT
jgi:hypothetical protein